MGLIDSLLNFGSNLVSAQVQYENQRKLNQQAYDLTQRGYRESPANQRAGLEAAGYNPILAASNGVSYGSFSGGSASMASNPGSSIDESITNAYRAFKLEREKNKADIQNLVSASNSNNAQANLANEQALTESYRRAQIDFQNAMYDVLTHLHQKDLDYYERKMYYDQYEQFQRAENYRIKNTLENYRAISDRINAQANATNAKGSYYYNTHRALGYTITESDSRSDSRNIHLHGVGANRSYNHSWSTTR